MKKIAAIVQARVNSSRFPNKVLQTIQGLPLIELLLKRLSYSKKINQIILATSDDASNSQLIKHVESLGIKIFQGSENDVLDRYYQAARLYQPEIIVRITGDCPLMDAALVDSILERYENEKVDYISNTILPTYPDGLDIEVFSFEALKKAWNEASRPYEREHVTPYLKESKHFLTSNVVHTEDYSKERWTVDEPEDFQVIKEIVEHFLPRLDFSWYEVLAFSKEHPEKFSGNKHIPRNEGLILNSGQKLWKRAKRVIPGGSMLLSKRAEMFLPEQWPAYFSKAKGCYLWDLEGNQLLDMCLMGIGTNILGYAHPEVDKVVHSVVENCNMTTLNCPEEVYLAEKLVELHPWANMVRFARSGGEANAISIRIARAAANRDKVALCGYHGWHDWYLAANLAGEKTLEGHLLPGLEPKGVPRNLKETVFTFNYNRFDELEALTEEHDIGVIKMEVMRNIEPQNDFLLKVRELATRKGIILIFDECTSGFRQALGGLHKCYNIEPDMAIFGKALGNGYSITAVIGKRDIMQYAQSTFISSTFWTERIGPAAGLKTLEIMERVKSYEKITHTGKAIGNRWQALGERYQLPMDIMGLPSMLSFNINSPNKLAYKTLITQEMLNKGILATNSIYVCTEHTPELIDRYFEALEPIFGLIRECEQGRPVAELLNGPVCDSGFRRLN